MAASRCQTTNQVRIGDGSKGQSNKANLDALFPENPIGKDQLDGATAEGVFTSKVHKFFQEKALDGVVENGFMMGVAFNREYENNGAPLLDNVDSGEGAGQPASPYVPNPASATDPANAATQPASPEGFGSTPNTQYGAGVESNNNSRQPSVSSAVISAVKLGQYGLGTSTPSAG